MIKRHLAAVLQKAPDLFSYIQVLVDKHSQPGRFIITGSQNFLLLEKISQSLAGRCSINHLMPLALTEIDETTPIEIAEIGQSLPKRSLQNQESLFNVLFRGFYPRIHDIGIEPQDWLSNYYQTYLERDVREIINIGDIDAFARFVRLCAGRCGQLLNLVSLANDCGILTAPQSVGYRRWKLVLSCFCYVRIIKISINA